ncbi:exported hypothetical protein [uncultured Desulfobacterium sp.]|uniref:Uncharacterized protein n=1 Tax=uncultured Desulfobacterium sp. TaxID=201089 RepID=A0A445MWC5_9BACT|nr:exported hypothetical protein [uncultured Desulfobacterium sp.]
MQRLKIYFLVVTLVLVAVCLPFSMVSADTILKIEATGMQYMDHYRSVKVTAKNNVDFWIRFGSELEMDLSLTSFFFPGTYVTIPITMYLVKANLASFCGCAFVDDGTYFSIQGLVKYKDSTIKSVSGTYIQNGIGTSGTFSSGKFKSVSK